MQFHDDPYISGYTEKFTNQYSLLTAQHHQVLIKLFKFLQRYLAVQIISIQKGRV
jgi:hypothetical protein